jgi:hypothetical protein
MVIATETIGGGGGVGSTDVGMVEWFKDSDPWIPFIAVGYSELIGNRCITLIMMITHLTPHSTHAS